MTEAHAKRLFRYIGANVYRLRHERGLTQEQLAEAAGIEPNYVQIIEYGRSNTTVKVLAGLADALGVDAKDLFEPAERPKAKRGRPPKKKP